MPPVNKLGIQWLSLYRHTHQDLTYRMPIDKAKGGWVALAHHNHSVSFCIGGVQHLEGFSQHYSKIQTGKGGANRKTTHTILWGDLKPRSTMPLNILKASDIRFKSLVALGLLRDCRAGPMKSRPLRRKSSSVSPSLC